MINNGPLDTTPILTVSKALTAAVERLQSAQVDTPLLDARLLMEWMLKVRREDVIREPDRVLTNRERMIYEKSISLRALRRPLPYITGEAWFYGHPYKINRAVLIPRPETELLVQAALGAVRDSPNPLIADIGTGSGCIAVSIALARRECRVWASDISPEALRIAAKNIARYNAAEQVTLVHGDLLTPLPQAPRFDVIVSNPPYIPESDIPALQPEVRDYEPALALSGLSNAVGADGTALHRRLLDRAHEYLLPGGAILLEVGQGQAALVADYAIALGYTRVRITDDYAGIGRIVSCRNGN